MRDGSGDPCYLGSGQWALYEWVPGAAAMSPERHGELGPEMSPAPVDTQLELDVIPEAPLQPVVECRGMRATTDFPRELTGLSPEQIEHHYKAMRNSHASLSRSRGQLLRRSRELSESRDRFLATLRSYEERLVLIGEEKAEAMRLAQEMHRELQAFETKQQALDRLLTDLDAAKQEAGFWSVFQINQLLDRMRSLLRGGAGADG